VRRELAPARRLRFALAHEALAAYAGDRPLRILDAGCGDGAFAATIAHQHPTWSIVGADVAEEMLERGREALAGLPNVELVHADLTEDLGVRAFDAVASIESLEEIPEDGTALRRMVSALRPGGLFVVHVPELNWKPVLPGSDAIWRSEVRHGYAAGELAERLRGLGLEDVHVEETSRSLVRIAQELRDRVPSRRPAIRAVVSSSLAFTASMERAGISWGRGRSLFGRAVAR
jgi:SAM-dependent methyltransferase